ncbi:uncharacterized protein LOC122521967 [Polistes fuscatus]|uniref:uncharacterized protein LOC122521967 n=1 Tax=Polistes fuscatus TaxID=30207 RepID=UPI001CA87DA7|nr:uncharacterized protein LOC122521967 [Polistes fuscatus]
MMKGQLATYRRYASFIKRLLFYSGLWPVENKKSSYFYRHIPILAIVYAALLFYGCVRFCKDNLDDVKAFTKGLSPLGSMVVVIIKVLMFFLYQEEIRELHLNLESIFEEVIEKTYCRPVLFEMLNIFKRPAYIFYYLTIITVIMLTCMPLLLIVYEAIKNINPRHYILPYPATFPWIDGSFGIKYELQYLHEIQVGWFIIFVTSGVDTAYGFYIFQMVGILRFMSLECEKIGKSSDELDIILLRNCIEKEILLLRCRDIIQNVYGPVVLNLIVSSVVVLCGLIFQVLQVQEISVGKAVVTIFYGIVKMSQAFMYSWYGSILVTESEAFKRNVYCSKWYQYQKIQLMKSVLLILAQKPIVLTACHFFYISLDLFVKVNNYTHCIIYQISLYYYFCSFINPVPVFFFRY